MIAQLIAQGPGVIWYRFGAGPGPWQPLLGSLVIPPGKQLLSAVLIAPDGTPGQVTTVVARSDIHAEPFSQTATSQATYSGAPAVAGVVTVSVLVGRQLGTIIRRLGGANRYGTGAVISSSVPAHGSTVIIATGEKFPDALTASGLAGCLDAPVLLVTKNHVPAETSTEIRRLRARHAIICGGPPAVSSAVATKLKSLGLSVERLSGPTRYETAVAVAARIRKLTGRSGRVFLARGDVFSDALVVAPLAYKTRAPVLLSGTSMLRASTAQATLRRSLLECDVDRWRPFGGRRERRARPGPVGQPLVRLEPVRHGGAGRIELRARRVYVVELHRRGAWRYLPRRAVWRSALWQARWCHLAHAAQRT